MGDRSRVLELWAEAHKKANGESSWRPFLIYTLNHTIVWECPLAPDAQLQRDRVEEGDVQPGAAALRALARLAEDDPRFAGEVAPTLSMALRANRPHLRQAAVEGIWQAGLHACVPDLIAAELVEDHPEVRRTMAHVLRALGAVKVPTAE